MFDRRGSGLSDPVPTAPTLEEQMDDVVAVMDAAGSERAAVFAQLEGGAMAALFAATHPERTTALVLYEAHAADVVGARLRLGAAPGGARGVVETGATRVGATARGSSALAPRSAANPRLRQWFARLERLAASPGTAAKLMMMNGEVDVRAVLPSIQVPTLVLHRAGDTFIDIRHSRYLAEHIPGARYVELPGERDARRSASDADGLLDEIEEFLTGARQASDTERILATVMFSDIVDSTERAARAWATGAGAICSSRSRRRSARELSRFRGRAVKTMGDGFLATFDGPARAIRCATAIRDAARAQFGLEVRSGLHTGEIEVIGDDVGGIAVHIGARVGASAAPGRGARVRHGQGSVVGSGIRFEDRGERELRGRARAVAAVGGGGVDGRGPSQRRTAPAAGATGAGHASGLRSDV